jgi:hypothetical protein
MKVKHQKNLSKKPFVNLSIKHSTIKKSKDNNKKIFYLVLAGVFLLVLFFAGKYFYMDSRNTKTIVEHSCGTIQGYVLQSIADEGQCKQFCAVRCESEQLRYKNSFFEQGALGECNKCTCICH